MPYRRKILVGLIALAPLAAASRAQVLPKESPFAPPAGSSLSLDTKAAPSNYEFMGMTVLGGTTLLSINCVNDKRSVWVPLGKTVNQITALSYDPRSESAVIRADNQTVTLKMRKAAILPGSNAPVVVAAAPTVAPAPMPAVTPPPADAPPPPPMTDEEKANEARMLVSDLLEIGLRQRQAYEAAQREANARAARNNPPPPASTKH